MIDDVCGTTTTTEQLDPGIADVVIMLRNLGFNPTDSGDGVSKPDGARDFDVKHVACAWKYSPDDPNFFEAANRLQRVLGTGWTVEASFSPKDDTYILLATKNDPPGPRHAAVLKEWERSVSDGLGLAGIDSPIYKAGALLYVALLHELGRR